MTTFPRPSSRAAWLEIDTAALTGNVRAIRGLLPPGTELAAVVKADGYGHGIVEAARAFLAGGSDRLCVAAIDEGVVLRRAGIRAPILVLFSIPSDGLAEALDADLELVAADEDRTRELLGRWSERTRVDPLRNGNLRLHLEIETGLGRGGVPVDRAAAVAASIVETSGVALAGIWSHLASAHDAELSALQVERFEAAVRAVEARGIRAPVRHLAATGGILSGTAPAYELVRPGLVLYGEVPAGYPVALTSAGAASTLRPALTLKAQPLRILQVPPGTPVGYDGRWRAPGPAVIATLPVGYGDGFVRASTPGGEALVRGRRVPLVGTVAMDAVAADVTAVPGVSLDDEFVLLGAQGNDRITASEVARLRTTISWEVLTLLARRLPRVYYAGPELLAERTLAPEIQAREDLQAAASPGRAPAPEPT